MVGLTSGKLTTLNLKTTDAKGNKSILVDAGRRPGPGTRAARFLLDRCRPASSRLSVQRTEGRRWSSPLMATRSTASRPADRSARDLERLGLGLLLIPSGDNNLYGVDLLAAKVLWTFPSGAPIEQEPMVADQDVYTINTAGNMSLIDPADRRAALDAADPGRASCRGQRRPSFTSAATTSICS